MNTGLRLLEDAADLASLVLDLDPSVLTEHFAKLTAPELEEICDWAAMEHLRAADNPVRQKPTPKAVQRLKGG